MSFWLEMLLENLMYLACVAFSLSVIGLLFFLPFVSASDPFSAAVLVPGSSGVSSGSCGSSGASSSSSFKPLLLIDFARAPATTSALALWAPFLKLFTAASISTFAASTAAFCSALWAFFLGCCVVSVAASFSIGFDDATFVPFLVAEELEVEGFVFSICSCASSPTLPPLLRPLLIGLLSSSLDLALLPVALALAAVFFPSFFSTDAGAEHFLLSRCGVTAGGEVVNPFDFATFGEGVTSGSLCTVLLASLAMVLGRGKPLAFAKASSSVPGIVVASLIPVSGSESNCRVGCS